MKRAKTVFLILLSLLLFSACGEGAPSQTADPPAPENLSWETPPATTFQHPYAAAKEGAYYIENQPDGGKLLVYFDYQNLKKIPLCSDPGCRHQDETCTAWFSYEASPQMLLVGGNKLYTYSINHFMKEETPAVWMEMGLNGAGRHELWREKKNPILHDGVATDGENLYYIADTVIEKEEGAPEKASVLTRLNLTEGSAEIWYSFQENEKSAELFGVGDGTFYIYTLAPIKVFREGQEFPDIIHQRTIRRFQVSTKTWTPVEEWTVEDTQIAQDQDGIWFFDKATCLLRRLDYATGEITRTTTKVELPQGYEDYAFDSTAWGGKLLVKMQYLTPEGAVRYDLYAIDPATGKTWPLTLTMPSAKMPEEETPIQLCAETQDSFLVVYGYEQKERLIPQEDGTLLDSPITEGKYALLAKEDYFANRPNYRPFTEAGAA